MFEDIKLYLELFDLNYLSQSELSHALFMHHPDPKIGRANLFYIWINIYKKDFSLFFNKKQ